MNQLLRMLKLTVPVPTHDSFLKTHVMYKFSQTMQEIIIQTYPAQQQTYPAQQQTYPAQQQTYPAQQQMYPAQQQTYPSQPAQYGGTYMH